MQAFIISYVVNVLLMVAILSIYGPRVIYYIRNKKKQRERQRVTEIQTIVNEYLKQLQND